MNKGKRLSEEEQRQLLSMLPATMREIRQAFPAYSSTLLCRVMHGLGLRSWGTTKLSLWAATDPGVRPRMVDTLLDTLRNNPGATAGQLAEICDCCRSHVRSALTGFQEQQLVRTDRVRNGRWWVVDDQQA